MHVVAEDEEDAGEGETEEEEEEEAKGDTWRAMEGREEEFEIVRDLYSY